MLANSKYERVQTKCACYQDGGHYGGSIYQYVQFNNQLKISKEYEQHFFYEQHFYKIKIPYNTSIEGTLAIV